MNTAAALATHPYGQSVADSFTQPVPYIPPPQLTRTSNGGCSTLGETPGVHTPRTIGATFDAAGNPVCCSNAAIYWLAAAVASVAGAVLYVNRKKKGSRHA